MSQDGVIERNVGRLFLQLERDFAGITYMARAIMPLLLARANPKSGIVDGLTYGDLQKLLYVRPAPGRKESGMPTKQTIRNLIKSIERECPEHFRVITEGQSLRFLFPTMSTISADAHAEVDFTVEVNTEHNIPDTGTSTVRDDDFCGEQHTELNTATSVPAAVMKNNIYKNNPTNRNSKKPIDPHFKPSREILEIAKGRGYLRADKPDEIAAFIHYNIMHQTEWADFNAVYLRWLENGSRYSQQQETRRQIRTENPRSSNHGGGSKKHSGSIIELVALHNQGAEHPGGESFIDPESTHEDAQPESLEVALAEIDECVRTAFHKQARPFGQRYLV